MKIIPAINCEDYETAISRIKLASRFLDPEYPWIHIDVVDGLFAPVAIWGNPHEFSQIESIFPGINFEIHLMVEHPEVVAGEWLDAGADRLIVHVESKGDPFRTKAICEARNCEVVLAAGPDASVEKLLQASDVFNFFQILGVRPGFAGQKFDEVTLRKIKFLRQLRPDAKIEVDGGINLETGKLVKDAGADILVAASYIFQNANPEKAYKELTQI